MSWMIPTTPETYKFQKDRVFVRSWLLGKGWYRAVKALDFASEFSEGRMRKDGKTPKFHHETQIALAARTLSDMLLEPEETLVCIFLHDVPEDFSVSFAEIEERFGSRARTTVELMTKKYQGNVKDYDTYFREMQLDPVASVAKGLDRCHNVWTMKNAFGDEKILSYSEEVDTYFLPMLKEARHNFPEQEKAYHNIAQQLRTMRDIYTWAVNRETE